MALFTISEGLRVNGHHFRLSNEKDTPTQTPDRMLLPNLWNSWPPDPGAREGFMIHIVKLHIFKFSFFLAS